MVMVKRMTSTVRMEKLQVFEMGNYGNVAKELMNQMNLSILYQMNMESTTNQLLSFLDLADMNSLLLLD